MLLLALQRRFHCRQQLQLLHKLQEHRRRGLLLLAEEVAAIALAVAVARGYVIWPLGLIQASGVRFTKHPGPRQPQLTLSALNLVCYMPAIRIAILVIVIPVILIIIVSMP